MPEAGKSAGTWRGVALDGDLGEHASAWDGLNRQRFKNHPLLDSRLWNGLLRQAAGRRVQLWALQDGPQVLALCLLEPLAFGTWRTFSPPRAAIAPVLIGDATMVDSLLLSLRPGARRLDLLGLDPAVCALDADPGRLSRVTLHERTMSIDTTTDFEAYLAQRPASLRQATRRHEQAAMVGGIPFEHRLIDQASALPQALRRYLDLLARTESDADTQAGPAGPGISLSAFVAEQMLEHGGSDRAAVHELWADTELAASRLVLHGGETVLALKEAGEPAAAAAGARLFLAILRLAFTDPAIRQVDFSSDAAPTYRAWSTDFRWQRHLRCYPVGARGQAGQMLDTARQVLAAPARSALAPAGMTVSQLALSEPWPTDVMALFAHAAKESLEISQPWYDNLFQAVFKNHSGASLWVLSKGGQSVAALPVLVTAAGPGQRLTALSNYYTAYFTPTVAPSVRCEELALLVRHLLMHHKGLGSLRFEPMDPHSDGFHRLIRAMELNGLACVRYFRFANWHLPAQASYTQYLKGRSASLRSTIKRMSKRSTDEGGRVEIITEPADVSRGMAAYWQVYHSSWKQDEPYPGFIDGLARWAAAQGALRLGLLWLNDAPIAAQLWLVANARCEIFKVAYDDAHKALSPGTVLTAALLARVIDQDRVTEVDFLIGDDQYKRNWMSHRRERWGVLAHDPRRLVGLLGLAREWAGWLLRQVRRRLPKRPPTQADPA